MTESSTPFGRLFVGEKEELFAKAVALAGEAMDEVQDTFGRLGAVMPRK